MEICRRNNPPTHILCDLSDVLVKGLRGVEVVLAGFLGLPEEQVSDFLFNYDFTPLWLGHAPEDHFLSELVSRSGWRLDHTKMKTLIRANFREIDGTRAVYSRLAEKYRLALLSVNAREWVENMEQRFRYSHLFDAGVFYSYQIGSTKREVKCFEHVLGVLGVPSKDLLFIDDSKRFIDVAAKAGISGVLFENPGQLQSDLRKLGV